MKMSKYYTCVLRTDNYELLCEFRDHLESIEDEVDLVSDMKHDGILISFPCYDYYKVFYKDLLDHLNNKPILELVSEMTDTSESSRQVVYDEPDKYDMFYVDNYRKEA